MEQVIDQTTTAGITEMAARAGRTVEEVDRAVTEGLEQQPSNVLPMTARPAMTPIRHIPHADPVVMPNGPVRWDHPAAARLVVKDREKGIVVPVDGKRREKVAIVGFATSTRHLVPYDDAEWEVWGLNQLYRFMPRADRWFDIHVNWNEYVVEGTDHLGWIAKAQIPVYMNEIHPPFAHHPFIVQYPVDAIIARHVDYFTSTIAFELALAIVEGFKEIALYGVDLIVGQEYEHQRQCCEFWIGVAHGLGIKVRIPPQSALMKQTHRYGYQVAPNTGLLKLDEMHAMAQKLTADRDAAIRSAQSLDGGIQIVTHLIQQMDLRLRGADYGPIAEVKK